MGQKVHPIGFRLGSYGNKDWKSKCYSSGAEYVRNLLADIRVRTFINNTFGQSASVSQVVIARTGRNVQITIHSARPGVILGRKGEELDKLRTKLAEVLGAPVYVSVEEIRKPELDAKLVADSIAQQLVKRVMFRRVMKRSSSGCMRAGAKGIKIMLSGRLGGAEIARTEWMREGRVPLHTLRADIDYAESQAKTTYGIIGIKIWIFKGELIGTNKQAEAASE